jgi:hypothetical protein
MNSSTSHEMAPNGLPKVVVRLVGEDGNAFSIIGRCRKAMSRARWSQGEIEAFTKEATSGDYDHLLQTVLAYCEEPEEDWWNEPDPGETGEEETGLEF